MPRSRLLIVVATVAALAVGSLAAPVAAADPKVTIVQGTPGKKVDVCFDDKERASKMPYGSHKTRSMAAGSYKVKVFVANIRRCKGTKLLSRTIVLAEDDDITIVPTKRAPKLVRYDNATPVGALIAADLFLRHAADLGPAAMAAMVQAFTVITPAAPTPFVKGDQTPFPNVVTNGSIRAIAFRLSGKRIVRSNWADSAPVTGVGDINRRIQLILVGTTKKNARFVEVNQQKVAP